MTTDGSRSPGRAGKPGVAAAGAEPPPAESPRFCGPRRATLWALAILAFLLTAEATARLDDAVFQGVPFLANPRYEDLFIRDALGRRGRPNAQFGKWTLNSFGFRGPEITPVPRPGCLRVALMGASETFGYDESPGHEFPALLRKKLAGRGCVEVVNVAVVGMSTGTMVDYWNNWVSRFRPDVVVVYSSPLFYLASRESPDARRAAGAVSAPPPAPAPPAASLDNPFESRFVKRMRGVGHAAVPAWAWMAWNKHRLEHQLRGVPADARIHAPPAAGLAAYEHDLVRLIGTVRSQARVVLLTHAQRADLPVPTRVLPDLWEERNWVPQADLPVFVEFDRAANTVTRQVAARENLQLIDAAQLLNGCWDCFGDLNHFVDKGSERMSDLLARELPLRKSE